MARTQDVAIERSDAGVRTPDVDHVVVEAPLQLRARGTPVATVMRTPGNDLELARGLLHAESIFTAGLVGAAAVAGTIVQVDEDAVDVDVDPGAFVGRGMLSSAACGVCGRVAIADLERRARPVETDATVALAVLAELPERLRAAQRLFAETGGLHAAGLFTLAAGERAAGELVAIREDVGRHNAVDKLVGWALAERIDPRAHVLVLSGRTGYELVQKAVMLGVPIVASVSAPSSIAVELAERFNVGLAGFVRGAKCNMYAHAWRFR